MMKTLDKDLRSTLERTVKLARTLAEKAAHATVDQLGVGHDKPESFLSVGEKVLRNRLRTHGKQLGDARDSKSLNPTYGKQEVQHLVQEVAYQHWHRMLFARFLADNELLMYDGVPVTLEVCDELAPDEGAKNGWELAGKLAARMLPQVFKPGSPVFELNFAPEHQSELERLLKDLPDVVFKASDSLGWVYQFWQADNKERINKSEVKISADELPAVTQLFTEPYMVAYVLDNSLGAWWAAQHLSEVDLSSDSSEDELRKKISLPGLPLDYLRFAKLENGTWMPSTGFFEHWPKDLAEFTTLDPCCGSGHFLVAAFLMLVPMRMARENLSAREAVDAVLRENINGLELDQRCVELAAFALALNAWRYPGAGGYRALPELNVACVGLSISASKDEWLTLAGTDHGLRAGLEEIYKQFQDAPLLGSLINPGKHIGKGTLFELPWDVVGPLIEKALGGEKSDEKSEMAVVASGIGKAAKMLSENYWLIFTNPPYLVKGKQSERLKSFLSSYYKAGDADMATVFLKRFDEFLLPNGAHCSVTPLNWYYLKSYSALRQDLLENSSILSLTKVGSGATAKASWDVLRAIAIVSKNRPLKENIVTGLEATTSSEQTRAEELKLNTLSVTTLASLSANPDAKFAFGVTSESKLLEAYAWSYQGPSTADYPLYGRYFWEVYPLSADWELQQVTYQEGGHYQGLTNILLWEKGVGRLSRSTKAAIRGEGAHGSNGVVITQTRKLPASIYLGGFFDNNVAILACNSSLDLPALWCYCSSDSYYADVRKLDEKLGVTNATLAKVPFDLQYWKSIAIEKYPNGLPKPYSNDPIQWVFHGHPCGSVVWDEACKQVTRGPNRTDGSVLQVAVARLLGFSWPAEVDEQIELSDESRKLVLECGALVGYVDNDGIVCIPAVGREASAGDRLLNLLAATYGEDWSSDVFNQLMAAADHAGKSLETWLRDKFFTQHCALFANRPFVWHVWDGLRDGFAALVSYHKLDYKTLEALIYTYLGDWISRQKRDADNSVDGAQEKLTAAEVLKKRLELILEGQKPYDIFVRWKPVEEQPVGWNPDLNDGVRLNIRPFLSVPDVGKKGAGVLRDKPKSLRWERDRGSDVPSAPWYELGLQYDGNVGDRINDHHLSLEEKQKARSGQ
ncbi:Eco57I restriction-modification methylase domain-containing protein [Pseudomonas sp. SDO5522_S412]